MSQPATRLTCVHSYFSSPDDDGWREDTTRMCVCACGKNPRGGESKEVLSVCGDPDRGEMVVVKTPVVAPPAELARAVAQAIIEHGAAHHICEANALSLDLASSLLTLTAISSGDGNQKAHTSTAQKYTVIPYGEGKAKPLWPDANARTRVIWPASRTIRGRLDAQIGICDTLIITTDSDISALRASVLQDLPLLMQHAAPQSLLVLHGPACTATSLRARDTYWGPFWFGNITVPCWQDRFAELVSAGSITHERCNVIPWPQTTIPGEGYHVCMGAFRVSQSHCGAARPLLHRWAAEEAVSAAGRCMVRKENVRLQSNSRSWKQQGWLKRPSLSHMLRRNIRYYSAHSCNGAQEVCLLFKDEVDEQWVAGMTSTNGLDFIGDPALVMPRLAYRAELYTELESRLLKNKPDAAIDEELLQRFACKTAHVPAKVNHEINWCDHCLLQNPSLTQRLQIRLGSMTHNLAMTFHRGEWLVVGGRHNKLDDFNGKLSPYLRDNGMRPKDDWWLPTLYQFQDKLTSRARSILATSAVDCTRALTVCNRTGMQSTPCLVQRATCRSRQFGSHVDPLARGTVDAFGLRTANSLKTLPQGARHVPRKGIWMMRGSSWRYAEANSSSSADWLSKDNVVVEPPRSPWYDKRLIIDGSHSGCVERREHSAVCGQACEYDGRLSLVSFKGTLLLYTRANPKSHGSRHVQVTRSIDDGKTWLPFEQISIDGYSGGGDIYFFGVQINPAHADSLVAVFPMVHRLRGCIGLTASTDGVRWTRIAPLLPCNIFGERTMEHPALPAMVLRGPEVWMYVQEEVPGITIDQRTPRFVYAQMKHAEKPSSLKRYVFPCARLASWTREVLRELIPDGDTHFAHSCSGPLSGSLPDGQASHDPSTCLSAAISTSKSAVDTKRPSRRSRHPASRVG